jgi:mRNA-degrading endonuclease RelE of RelBE toxin-antitoxin system
MMEFRIADTFTESLTKLTNQEQKAVKTTAFDLQVNPSQPGLQFHKLDRLQDPNFASVRVNQDIRLIVHQSRSSLLICYVGHHEDAYQWVQRRKLERHPKTGAAQLVEIRQTVQDVVIPNYIVAERPTPPLFTAYDDQALLGFGVPLEWLEDVRQATEDSLLILADHLPSEAAEALLEIATGGTPKASPEIASSDDPFEHPDALRRFRVMQNVEELQRALEYPWDKWTIFLHPEQRRIVEAILSGPARVSGSAGTGKTIVALHRAVYLAKSNPATRVLLLTFSETLAESLRRKLIRLIDHQPAISEQIEIYAFNALAERLYRFNMGKYKIASREIIQSLLEQASNENDVQQFSAGFLLNEWEQVVDAWQLDSWDAYRDIARLGRKTRLPESRRQLLWSIFERVQLKLKQQDLITYPMMYARLSAHFADVKRSPFDYCIIDEAQDISVTQLRFLAALSIDSPNSLFFAGDLGQRIFQEPFSWLSLGIDIRGRSKTLRINYRTSHQIRMQADKLLGPEISDVDGNTESRRGTISVFNGPEPIIKTFETEDEERQAVGEWLLERVTSNVQAQEIGVFVRSSAELKRAEAAIEAVGLKYKVLDESVTTSPGEISLCTMHLAKGLEFRAVAVMACDDEIIPSQARIEQITDTSDLEEVYNTERHLLYVACTRARDNLLVTGAEPGSEFMDDMLMEI